MLADQLESDSVSVQVQLIGRVDTKRIQLTGTSESHMTVYISISADSAADSEHWVEIKGSGEGCWPTN